MSLSKNLMSFINNFFFRLNSSGTFFRFTYNITLDLLIINLDKTSGVFCKSYPLIFKSQHTDSGDETKSILPTISFLIFFILISLEQPEKFFFKKKNFLFSAFGFSAQTSSTEFFES